MRGFMMSGPHNTFAEPQTRSFGIGTGMSVASGEYGAGHAYDLPTAPGICTISDLQVSVSANAIISSTFNVYVSGTVRLSVTYGGSETGRKTDTTSYAAAQSSWLEFQAATTATQGNSSIATRYIACSIKTTVNASAISCSGKNGYRVSGGVADYAAPIGGSDEWSTTESLTQTRWPVTGTIDFLSQVDFSSSTTPSNLRLRIDGATSATITYGISETGTKSTGLIDVTRGQLVNLLLDGNGQLNYRRYQFKGQAQGGWYPLVLCFASAGITIATTTAQTYQLQGVMVAHATEAAVQYPVKWATKFSQAWGNVTANAATGPTTMTLRDDGADTALALSWGTNETGTKTNEAIVHVAAGSLVNWRWVSGSAGSVTVRGFSMAAQGPTSLRHRPVALRPLIVR